MNRSPRITGFAAAFALLATIASAQIDRCGTMEHLNQEMANDPKFALRRADIEAQTQAFMATQPGGEDVVRVIPVVVHVVWNTATENISDSQIQSQMAVLNQDFRRTNPDAGSTLAQWLPVAADVEFQFCLASRDPNGGATNGITRTQTATTSFSTNNAVKSDATGGKTGWPSSSYLNIWVCDLSSGLLGYATFPGGSASVDGVVIDYAAFGTIGTAAPPFHLGRTATHEIGHWLNLIHIWGDSSTCGIDDGVADTPDTNTPYYGCPTGSSSCGNLAMIQNYMDYSDDGCMNLFTLGQKSRMQALFNAGGARVSLLSSLGCTPPVAAYQVNQAHAGLTVDGVQGTASTPAVTTKCVNAPATLALTAAAGDVGLPADTGVATGPLLPASGGGGGVVLPDGQMVNLNLGATVFLSTGTAVAAAPPWPGNQTIPFSVPAPLTFSLQRLQVTPAVAIGFALSQGAQVNITAGGTFPAGPTGDDASVLVSLGTATCFSNVVFYGTSYSQFNVGSNGRLIFSATADNDFSPSTTEPLTDAPSVGFWTDFDPSVGGTITVTSPAVGLLRVNYNNIRYFGETVANSYAVEFNSSTNSVTLDGLLNISPNPQTGGATTGDRQWLGISRGLGAATNNGETAFVPGGSGAAPNGTAMVFQYYNAVTGGTGLVNSLATTSLNRIVFTPIANGNYSWAGF